MDSDGYLHATLLSLHHFQGAHNSFNQAEHIWCTIEDYEIAPFVGMFNVDNTTNNDTTLTEIASHLRLAGHESFNPIEIRLRRFGHVLNLAVKAILWGMDIEAFDLNYGEAQRQLGVLREWQRKGPLKKLHNVVTYILKTPQRRDAFESVVKRVYLEETVHTVFVGNITQ